MVSADQLPPVDQLNVVDFPRTSGILTDRELFITETSATALVPWFTAQRSELPNDRFSRKSV
ncbi:hypothetical protein BJX70DRAFT_375855 [Aspergillus crustosus]